MNYGQNYNIFKQDCRSIFSSLKRNFLFKCHCSIPIFIKFCGFQFLWNCMTYLCSSAGLHLCYFTAVMKSVLNIVLLVIYCIYTTCSVDNYIYYVFYICSQLSIYIYTHCLNVIYSKRMNTLLSRSDRYTISNTDRHTKLRVDT